MPGPGLHYLENLSGLMEKYAKLQKAYVEIALEYNVLNCRIEALERRSSPTKEKKGPCEVIMEDTVQSETDPQPDEAASRKERHRSSCSRIWRMKTDTSSLRAIIEEYNASYQTGPSIRKRKNNCSLWGRLKGLFVKRRRRSLKSSKSPH